MKSIIVKVETGWAVRLEGYNLQRVFSYKKEALKLQATLSNISKQKVQST